MNLQTNKAAVITNFYCFTEIENLAVLKAQILVFCRKKYIKGTILLAREGFNGSLAGEADNIQLIIAELRRLTAAQDIIIKTNHYYQQPFDKLKIKIKPEIVTLGCPEIDLTQRGQYIAPDEWDKFVQSEEVIMIDTRNYYEVAMGSFKGAINPLTTKFSDLPQWVQTNKILLQDKKIAMYCTGGVRCEKSTAYLKGQGFSEVYHLQGGILQYLADTSNNNALWQGQCFVFDNRIAVDQHLEPSKLPL